MSEMWPDVLQESRRTCHRGAYCSPQQGQELDPPTIKPQLLTNTYSHNYNAQSLRHVLLSEWNQFFHILLCYSFFH